jgi:hypothetical protein
MLLHASRSLATRGARAFMRRRLGVLADQAGVDARSRKARHRHLPVAGQEEETAVSPSVSKHARRRRVSWNRPCGPFFFASLHNLGESGAVLQQGDCRGCSAALARPGGFAAFFALGTYLTPGAFS